MSLTLAILLGGVTGPVSWLLARSFVARYRGEVPSPAWLAGELRAVARLVAVLCAGLSLGAYVGWAANGAATVFAALLVSGILAAITIVDLSVRRIPNALIIALLAWSAAQLVWLGRPGVGAATLGLFAGGAVFAVLALLRRGAMGAGDVKLVAALGCLVGYPLILSAMFWGIVAGGLAALVLLLTRRARRKDTMAYGPYLALGGWVIYLGLLELLPILAV